jgi:hypothetical protein
MERRGRWCEDGEERGRGVHLIREILLRITSTLSYGGEQRMKQEES